MTARRPLATIYEVADYLKVTDKTLRRWIRIGYGPRSFRVGNEIRYRWDQVEEWLEAQLQTPDAAAEDEEPDAHQAA